MIAIGPFNSLKVTDFRTSRKPVCNFLLVSNTNLYLAPFLGYHGILVKLLLLTGLPLFNFLIQVEPLNYGLQNLASKKIEISLYHVLHSI